MPVSGRTPVRFEPVEWARFTAPAIGTGREVALEVLPADVHAAPDHLARFQREAQLRASLNHPGIAAIYGLERAGGVPALVLELVEGETLADRLAHARRGSARPCRSPGRLLTLSWSLTAAASSTAI